MKYAILIRQNATGVERLYADQFDWDDEGVMEFCWTEGNYACDCNRDLSFKRADGEQAEPSFDDDSKCGMTAYSVLYAERPDGTRLTFDEDEDTAAMAGEKGGT